MNSLIDRSLVLTAILAALALLALLALHAALGAALVFRRALRLVLVVRGRGATALPRLALARGRRARGVMSGSLR